MGLFDKLFKNKEEEKVTFPPVPKWRPATPADHNKILEMAKFYTGGKLQLAVMQYGTIVLFPQSVVDIAEEAKATLHKILYTHPDFKPGMMDDGNYLVQYSHPAFTIVFKDELEQYWDYIEANYTLGVCPGEVLLNAQGQANVFDQTGKICLFARAKMFMDAQGPKVIQMFNPQKA